MLDETRSWGLEVPMADADAGYGDAGAFRHGLQERGLHYVVGGSARCRPGRRRGAGGLGRTPGWDARRG
nr:transposase [Streptomyces phaeoluteigriseus]